MKAIQLISAAGVISVLAGAALANPTTGSVSGHNGDSRNVYGNSFTDNGADNPVSDETIATNQEIYDNREEIALLAQWIGPGPGDLLPILAGDDTWKDRIRAEAAALHRKHAGLGGELGDSISLDGFAASPGVRVVDDGSGPDNTSHTVSNLWPTVLFNGSYIAEIPYSFSDTMIAAWGNRATSTDPEELNAIAGIANTLAVMLILEQELPVRFVGFNPNIHHPNGILLMENIGVGIPTRTPDTNNEVTRIGRANITDPDALPTQITHNSWQNFPSMIRSFGFVLGLDWEQRHPDRDSFIDVQLQNIPPAAFPPPAAPADGNIGPGITDTFALAFDLGVTPPVQQEVDAFGPLLFDQTVSQTTAFSESGCGFDLDSMMLIRPFDYQLGSALYIIKDAYRYTDLNGDGTVDTTPFGADDRMVSQPQPVYFSDCDIAALTALYTQPALWYYGIDNNCPHDVDQNGIQDFRDIQAFVEMWQDGDARADIFPDFGVIDLDDLDAFILGDDDGAKPLAPNGDTASIMPPFIPGYCGNDGLPNPANRPDRVVPN